MMKTYLPDAPVWMCGFRSFFLAAAAMAAMMQQRKIDLAVIEAAVRDAV